jgi:hypothetical protein
MPSVGGRQDNHQVDDCGFRWETKRGSFLNDPLFVSPSHGQGITDVIEGIFYLVTQYAHDGEYKDGHQGENNRIFHEPLASFLEGE